MKIGLDLSVIQTPHRMRGIGSTAINFVKNIPPSATAKHTFVLFLYADGQNEALDILDLKNVSYEVRTLKKVERINLKFPGRLRRINGPLNSFQSLIARKRGDQRMLKNDLSDLDAYIQFDQLQVPPKKRNLKTAVILYDLIPYVMEKDYLWSYATARAAGDSRKSALRKALLRRQYLAEVKTACKLASTLLAISAHTKADFVKYAGIKESKIKVVHLGINIKTASNSKQNIKLKRFKENSWGYFPVDINLSNKPFLLFVGGADPRRRIIDLVAAYNNLKAQGHDIRLVLAGDSMKGPKNIPTPSLQEYIADHSYADDIAFLGFVSDEEREWLYKNTLAMVYPSMYEGFGLPILEAMQYGTPVITYKNSSIAEIASNAAIYAQDYLAIVGTVRLFLEDSSIRKNYAAAGLKQSQEFSWSKTTREILKFIAG